MYEDALDCYRGVECLLKTLLITYQVAKFCRSSPMSLSYLGQMQLSHL